jgi:hypothetical protein
MRKLIAAGLTATLIAGLYAWWAAPGGADAVQEHAKNRETSGLGSGDVSLSPQGSVQGSGPRSEDVFRNTSTLSDALHHLLPRIRAGDYDALRAFGHIMRRCVTLRDGGPTAYDEFLKDKSALQDPMRKATISKASLYCQSAGKDLAMAEEVFAKYDMYELQAIKQGDPEAIVMGHLLRADLGRAAPEHSSREALREAIAKVEREGSPSSKSRLALARLTALGGAEVQAIDQEAIDSNAGDPAELHAAASFLYGCRVGMNCDSGGEIQFSSCLIDGECRDMPVETYIRSHQFNAAQIALIDKYLEYLESKSSRTGGS